MKRKEKEAPEIVVPEGYDVTDLAETDDNGYGFDYPEIYEEVKIKFE